jgi:hypothetical protein
MNNPTTKDLNWIPYSISLEEAETRVSNWIDAGPTTIYPTDMRAFVVHREDFTALLAQQDTEFVRLYVGRKKKEDSEGMESCLVLVSAARQSDIIPDGDPEIIMDLIGKVTIREQTFIYEIYDFSRPCPPICDVASPLFIGEADERCA